MQTEQDKGLSDAALVINQHGWFSIRGAVYHNHNKQGMALKL